MTRDWTPRLSPDGIYYCSPACGGGRLCKKSAYDLAVKRADELVARLGAGWSPVIWENLGWYYRAEHGAYTTVYAHHHRDETSYTVHINIPTGDRLIQFTESASDPNDALGVAKQKARSFVSALNAVMDGLL